MIPDRVAKVREMLQAEGVDAFLVTNPTNVRYLSGFTGDDSALLVSDGSVQLITDFRYLEQAEQEAPGCELVKREDAIVKEVAEQAADRGFRQIAFESASVSFAQYEKLTDALEEAKLCPTQQWVEGLRIKKDGTELERIREAIRVAEEAFGQVRQLVRPGVRERDLANEMEYALRQRGADKGSFDIIAAAAERASLPHARPTDRKLEPGDAVLFDWGARKDLYCSDLTRVVFLGGIDSDVRRIYQIVLDAQARAIESISPGMECKALDAVARDHIASCGHKEHFGHGLGHGVGMEIHEAPRVAEKGEGEIESGMVFTVEPGIYLPGQVGVRIEDMAVVTKDGCEILTSLEKRIDEMVL